MWIQRMRPYCLLHNHYTNRFLTFCCGISLIADICPMPLICFKALFSFVMISVTDHAQIRITGTKIPHQIDENLNPIELIWEHQLFLCDCIFDLLVKVKPKMDILCTMRKRELQLSKPRNIQYPQRKYFHYVVYDKNKSHWCFDYVFHSPCLFFNVWISNVISNCRPFLRLSTIYLHTITTNCLFSIIKCVSVMQSQNNDYWFD